MNQREQTIERIRDLPPNRDKQFSPFIHKKYDTDKQVIVQYLNKSILPIASVQNKKYKVVILNDYSKTTLFIKLSNPYTPVPSGKWMDWWEPDHEKFFNTPEKKYHTLTSPERATIEAKLQLKLWVEKEYLIHYKEFYYPKQHDEWWLNVGANEAFRKMKE